MSCATDAAHCQACHCGHCRHLHEKWRWYRACSVCTPRLHADEWPNEILPDAHGRGDAEVLRAEFARHFEERAS